jgi:hypothetical protein
MKIPFSLKTCALHAMLLPTVSASESINLSGTWQLQLSQNPDEAPVADHDLSEIAFDKELQLPGMLTAQGFGKKPSMDTDWTGGGW